MRDIIIQVEGKDEITLYANVIEKMIDEHEKNNPSQVFDKILLKENNNRWLFKILYKEKVD